MWNKTKLKREGETILNVTNPKNSTTHSVKFVVVNDSLNCLLGLETVQMMNLISLNVESFIAKIAANDDLGNLGVVSLHVSSYVYGVFGAQRSRDCTVTVLVSQIKRGHVTALSQ